MVREKQWGGGYPWECPLVNYLQGVTWFGGLGIICRFFLIELRVRNDRRAI